MIWTPDRIRILGKLIEWTLAAEVGAVVYLVFLIKCGWRKVKDPTSGEKTQ